MKLSNSITLAFEETKVKSMQANYLSLITQNVLKHSDDIFDIFKSDIHKNISDLETVVNQIKNVLSDNILSEDDVKQYLNIDDIILDTID